jgi:plasmid stabilization system protein ParE
LAAVVVTPTARDDLERMIQTHSLPPDTRSRVKSSLRALSQFPLLGASLTGPWVPLRFVLGPWRWMLIVYWYDEATGRVFVVTIQDARSSAAATS